MWNKEYIERLLIPLPLDLPGPVSKYKVVQAHRLSNIKEKFRQVTWNKCMGGELPTLTPIFIYILGCWVDQYIIIVQLQALVDFDTLRTEQPYLSSM